MVCELLPHLLYSPDLAPSDLHLFGLLKESLEKFKFEYDPDIEQHFISK